jgi:hypothetical protein
MLNKTIDDELVCVCVLRILIIVFFNYNVRIYNFLWKFVAHLKPCGGAPCAAAHRFANTAVGSYHIVPLKVIANVI